MMGCQIVKTVAQSQCLRVGQAFAHLFDSSVNISAVNIQFLDRLTLKADTKSENAVCCRMLRTDIDDIFILIKQHFPFLDDATVLENLYILGHICRYLIGHS